MNPNVLREVENGHVREDGVLGDFCDGNFVRSHPIFLDSDNAPFLEIIAYYDEIEVANPLGSKASNHKLGMNIVCQHTFHVYIYIQYMYIYIYIYIYYMYVYIYTCI